jgi:hypothetical protein
MIEGKLEVADVQNSQQTGIVPSRARAGIGGIGGGTGLVAIAQSIGPHTALGATILYLSPAASYVVGLLLFYGEIQASRYLELRLVANARKTLERQLDNPRTSASHKAKIRRKLEQLEESIAATELERIKVIKVPR